MRYESDNDDAGQKADAGGADEQSEMEERKNR
jgi:hypothetical protein